MTDNPRRVYEGSAREYALREPEEPLTLEHAILDAYTKATNGRGPRSQEDPFVFKITAIYVEGTNPPSDYRVHLADR